MLVLYGIRQAWVVEPACEKGAIWKSEKKRMALFNEELGDVGWYIAETVC